MQKFNSIDLFTGYLKQKLHDFNLPKVKIYTQDQQDYFNKYGVERYDVLETITPYVDAENNKIVYPERMRFIPYLKDGLLQEYIDGKWIPVGKNNTVIGSHSHRYSYGDKILNYTKNFKIKNNIYDTYTHEYLGDYLRFHRDFLGIDLMPLYNCFSNNACPNLKIKSTYLASAEAYNKVTQPDKLKTLTDTTSYIDYFVYDTKLESFVKVTDANHDKLNIIPYNESWPQFQTIPYTYSPEKSGEFEFNTADKNYKIYMIPVKLFKCYTIAIDSSLPIEMCCGIYGKYQDQREKFLQIPGLTYKKIPCSQFAKPMLYTGILNLNQFTLGNSVVELAQNECDLKLFLKVPLENDSTIIMLEGDYLNWNDYLFKKTEPAILDISKHGEGAPTTPPTSSDTLYLDTAKKILYHADFDNGQWVLDGPIWQNVSSELLTNGLIIDNNSYPDLDEKGEEGKEQYFEYYRMNTKRRINVFTAYFNTYINKLFINQLADYVKYLNNSVIDINSLTNEREFALITQLQLLRLNTKQQHPFADRLVEYLLENTITNRPDEIADNIKRAQKILELNFSSNGYIIKYPGLWEYKLNKIIYDYINNHNNTFDVNHDILGYVDKDIEKYYTYTTINSRTGQKTAISILNAELTSEEK